MTVSATDFAFVRDLVHVHSGLALQDGKEYLVDARLSPIAEREGLASVDELIDKMRRGNARLRADAVEAMATHETYFFRDVHPFDAVRNEIIPPLLKANGGSGLAIWSAASATGQEAYSLAIMMREHFPGLRNLTILATDFSNEVLAVGQQGRYTQLEVNRGLPASLLVKYFDRDGRDWQVKDSIRQMVRFRELNLVKPYPRIEQMDIVLLRNVLTYFDVETKADVLAKMARIVRPGGYLFLGGSETTYGLDTPFNLVRFGRTVCYRARS